MPPSEQLAWAADTSVPVLARLSAAHADCRGRQEARLKEWHKTQAPAMEMQMKMMEETIQILERELKATQASLAKAEAEERSGGRSALGTPADLELMLGVLEDKVIRTLQELETARRLTYFPAVEGYQLRFNYKDTFLGFKELLLEQLSGLLSLSITPGVGAAGQSAKLPTVILKIAGSGASSSSSSSSGDNNDGGGALLRFLGEGISIVTRREMLGVSLTPNISLPRMDITARFVATIPLVYLPRRKSWKPEAGFKIELLHFTEATPGATDQILRVVIQGVVEGLLKTYVHRQLGPFLGDYLRAATDGIDLEMEVAVRGVPISTFDAKLSEWAAQAAARQKKAPKGTPSTLAAATVAASNNGSDLSHEEEAAAASAARLIGMTAEQVGMLSQVQALLPSLDVSSSISSSGSASVSVSGGLSSRKTDIFGNKVE